MEISQMQTEFYVNKQPHPKTDSKPWLSESTLNENLGVLYPR